MSLPGYLLDVYLGRVAFARRDDWEPEGLQYAVSSETQAQIAHDRSSVQATLRAVIVWHRGTDGEVVEGPFDLAMDVVGVFSWTQPEATDEDIVGWAEFNSEHLLWPYLRSYVSMITSESGLPKLTLFTITVPSPALGGQSAADDDLGWADEQGSVPPELTS